MEGITLGNWIRERRKELWLTQKKLARLVGCAPVTIQKIEEGYRRPSAVVAESLAQHLEIEATDLERFLRLATTSPTVSRASSAAKMPANQVPLPLTALIGREAELASLSEILLHAPTRLLTLTGSPGMGKTRLALQLAQELSHGFADGIYFVPLAALDNPEQVMPSVIRRLGLVDGGIQSRVSRLQTFLRDKKLLLILDNFEHLLTAAPALSGLLEQCSGLRVLATSRTALRLYGEQEWSLEPLPLPKTVHFTDNPAVRLFLERVRAFDPKFKLNPHNANAIVEIVTRLEGLPLALELAAVRLRHASPEELATQLRNQVLAALGAGPIDHPERQRTLQGAIAWSYERLEERLKRIFRHIGIFVGGFDSAATLSICEARDTDLHTLLDGHLIQRDGERYTLFETLREYALEQLIVHQELEAARGVHLEYCLEASLKHEDIDLNWFESEIGNLRATLRWAIDNVKTKEALQLALRLRWFWETKGYQREGLEWFKAVLVLPGEVEPELRFFALHGGSTMAWESGVFEPCQVWLSEAIALSRKSKNVNWEALILMHQGKVSIKQGKYQESLEVLEAALTLSRQLNDPWLLSATLFQLADAFLALRNHDKAQKLAEEALAICRQHPGFFWEPLLLQIYGVLILERNDFPNAQSILSQALTLAIKLEYKGVIIEALAKFAASLTAPEFEEVTLLRAARLWGTVEATREINGYQWAPADGERIEHWTDKARKRVPDLEWNLAWISGRAMTLPEALEYALAPEKVRVSRS